MFLRLKIVFFLFQVREILTAGNKEGASIATDYLQGLYNKLPQSDWTSSFLVLGVYNFT
jgi:hypothetical protein